MILPDLLGHIGYLLLVVGMILLAHKKTIGWLFRLSGEVFWTIAGFMLGLSSIWFWCIVFFCLDGYGFVSWRKSQKSTTRKTDQHI